jgi:predicted amidohydrolase
MPDAELSTIKAGLIQFNARINEYDKNVARAVSMLDACAAEGCRLACLPEAFSTSLDLGGAKKTAESIPGKTTDILCGKARGSKMHIVAGIMEKDGGAIYSSAVLITDTGEIAGVYRRNHIYQLEKRVITGGNGSKVFSTGVARIGIIIGYDINFPESSRSLFRQRAELIICPSQIPEPFSCASDYLSVARAAENSCYFLFVNSVGENALARLKYSGNSLIARSPVALDHDSTDYVKESGIIARGNSEESIVYGELDLSRLRREQAENPHYKDMLPAYSY